MRGNDGRRYALSCGTNFRVDRQEARKWAEDAVEEAAKSEEDVDTAVRP